MTKPMFDQINVVCGDLDVSVAFYRRLGVEIPGARVWRTATGAHHATAAEQSGDQTIDFERDSAAFAPYWNTGWKGRADLRRSSTRLRTVYPGAPLIQANPLAYMMFEYQGRRRRRSVDGDEPSRWR